MTRYKDSVTQRNKKQHPKFFNISISINIHIGKYIKTYIDNRKYVYTSNTNNTPNNNSSIPLSPQKEKFLFYTKIIVDYVDAFYKIALAIGIIIAAITKYIPMIFSSSTLLYLFFEL